MDKQQNTAQILKGLLDALVLYTLQDGDSYGFEIYQKVTGLLDEDDLLFKESTLYPLLHRLEAKDFLQAYWKPGSRGTDRKYYRITKPGKNHLIERIADWGKVHRILDKTILRNLKDERQKDGK